MSFASETPHDKIQQEIFMYCWNTYPQSRYCMWHTPNEFKKDSFLIDKVIEYFKGKLPYYFINLFKDHHQQFIIQLAKRKAIGVLKGVPDLTLYYRGVLYTFDVKIGHDKLSPEQIRFINTAAKNGGQFYEINSIDQGKQIIDQIFSNGN